MHRAICQTFALACSSILFADAACHQTIVPPKSSLSSRYQLVPWQSASATDIHVSSQSLSSRYPVTKQVMVLVFISMHKYEQLPYVAFMPACHQSVTLINQKTYLGITNMKAVSREGIAHAIRIEHRTWPRVLEVWIDAWSKPGLILRSECIDRHSDNKTIDFKGYCDSTPQISGHQCHCLM